MFALSGLGPIPAPDNPHKLIASYARDMEVVVLNGHVHTTEIYDVDGVKYLMLGGGGAEQDPILPGRELVRLNGPATVALDGRTLQCVRGPKRAGRLLGSALVLALGTGLLIRAKISSAVA